MKKILITCAAACMLAGCTHPTQKMEKKITDFLTRYEAEVTPLYKAAALASWKGSLTGSPADFEEYTKYSMQLTEVHARKADFELLKEIKASGAVQDAILTRQLEVVYNAFLENQADTALLNKIIAKGAMLEQKYANFRADYKGMVISDNEVEEVLRTSTNNKDLEAVWRGHKSIGPLVAADVLEVVKLRNQLAKGLGFENYHSMTLELSGQDPKVISALFDELDQLTRPAFAELKKEMDAAFAKRYKIREDQLMPWHYQGRYFQEAPNLYPVDLDSYYKGKDLEALTTSFYQSIGLDITKMMANSDLYAKPGKNQHAFCTDIDRQGDIRVLCNIKDNESWMGTMLHEFGHAVYAQGHDTAGLPYVLRDAAHTFTTEAVAMIFGRLSRNPQWMAENLGISEADKQKIASDCDQSLRLQQLVFSRWAQVLYRFEKEMYANPDQDLNALWWNLVESYQMLRKPAGRNEPDWATKIHIALYPCYYHNYQLGELFASQMHYYIVKNIIKSDDYKNQGYTGNKAIGEWMSANIFAPGMKWEWNEMIRRATGEPLSVKYYARQFVE